MSFPGMMPEDIIHPFYKDKQEQLRELYITKLLSHKKGIERNVEEVNKRNERFHTAALIMVGGFILAFFCSLSGI